MTTTQKIHVALNTNKFDESVAFYRGFFGKDPLKLKPGYAKFELQGVFSRIIELWIARRTLPGCSGPSDTNHVWPSSACCWLRTQQVS